MNFIVSDYFAECVRFAPHSFIVEGVTFELMPLTDDLIEEIKKCDTYEDMLVLAANSGLSFNETRVIDVAGLENKLAKFWDKPELDLDLDPCVQYRVGEKVCGISGLDDFLAETLERETEEKEKQVSISGDDEALDLTLTIEQRERLAENARA